MAGEEGFSTAGTGVPTPHPTDFNPVTPVMQGVQTAMSLASQAEQVQSSKAKLSMLQEQHKQQALDKYLEIGTKIASAKGGYQKVLFDQYNRVAPMAGLPGLNEDMLATISANQDLHNQLMGQLAANPELARDQEFMAKYASADPSNFRETMQFLIGDATKRRNADVTATASTQNAAAREDTKQLIANQNDATKRLGIAVGGAKAGVSVINPETGQVDYNMINGTADEIRGFAAQKADALTSNALAATSRADSSALMAKANAQYKKDYIDAYNKRTDAMKNRILQGRALGQGRLINGVDNSVAAATKAQFDVVGQADRGLDLLNRGPGQVRWADLNEANLDLVGLLQNGKGVIPVSRSAALQPPKGVKGTLEQIYSKISGVETGGPNPEELTIIKDRLNRVRDEVAKFHDTKLAQSFKAKNTALSAAGVGPDVVENLFNARKIRDDSTFGAVGTRSDRATTIDGAAGGTLGGTGASKVTPAPGGATAPAAPAAPVSKGPIPPAMLQQLKAQLPDPAAYQRAVDHLVKTKGYAAPGGQ